MTNFARCSLYHAHSGHTEIRRAREEQEEGGERGKEREGEGNGQETIVVEDEREGGRGRVSCC